MTTEPLETFQLTLTAIRGSEPLEVAFFLIGLDGNVFHSGAVLFPHIQVGFKAAFNMTEAALDALESELRRRSEVNQRYTGTRSAFRIAGLLPPEHIPPLVDMTIHVKAPAKTP
jgi:hypothetical protein